MNKERYNQIIDEVYKNYESRQIDMYIPIWSQEQFINKCKTDSEFSEKWGLKIEERMILEQVDQTNPVLIGSTALRQRKLITITYNNETIESYE